MNKEKDPLEERRVLIQNVIDRSLKYKDAYTVALNEFNKQFPLVTEIKILNHENFTGLAQELKTGMH